jgi:DNA helicase-2/ATP-dependent DNA helicase PcrA
MWEVLKNAGQYGFKGAAQEAISNFVTMITYFQNMLEKKNAYDVAFQVGKDTGLVKELFNDKTTEGLARYENVQELLNSIKEFTETPMNEEDGEVGDKGLGAYLQQITLLTDADDEEGEADVVRLMSIHAAKGLEFPCVFVSGLEEGLFPNAMAINTRDELEEERRLFYVAVTRAKKHLWLTYANTRYRFGQLIQSDASRFIEEVPEQYLDRSFSGGGARNQGQSAWGGMSAFERMNGGRSGSTNYQQQPKTEKKPAYMAPAPKPKTVEHTPSADFIPSDPSTLREGMKVEHPKFGFGKVLKLEGAGHNPIATIHFELNGEKKIMLNYARIRIVE